MFKVVVDTLTAVLSVLSFENCATTQFFGVGVGGQLYVPFIIKWQAEKRAKAVKETKLCVVQMDRVQHVQAWQWVLMQTILTAVS